MSWLITPQTKVPADPYCSQVSLLLHGNGANGSTTITDSSLSPKTVTAAGDAQISTAQSKFGGGSILFDTLLSNSSGGDYLQVANSSGFDFGVSDFTIELWYFPIARTTYSSIINRDTADYPWCLFHGSSVNSGNPGIQFGSNTAWSSQFLSFGYVENNQWCHLAVTRTTGVFRTFNNGTLVNTDSSWSGAIQDNAGPLQIGKNGSSNGYTLRAYINELRITKGVARYTANFTPPTAPFPDF